MRRALPVVGLAAAALAVTAVLGRVAPTPRSASPGTMAPPVMAPTVMAPRVAAPAAPREAAPEAERGGPGVAIGLRHPERLDALYTALTRAEEGRGRATLAFWGGSHTASDLYTGPLRDRLQARFGDLGHGFVPVAPVITDHWSRGLIIDDAEGVEAQQVSFKRREIERYGLAGVRFVAYEDTAFAAVQSDRWGHGRFASRLTLLYDRIPEGGTLDVVVDGAPRERLETAAPAATPGVWRTEVSDGPHRLEVRLVGDRAAHFFGARFERDGPGVLLHNLGLAGSKARHQLLWEETLFRAFVEPLALDLIAFAYGNNETDDPHLTVAQHEAHLDEALRRVRAMAPGASCLLVGPTDRPWRREDGTLGTHPLVEPLTRMTERVADAQGCAFFDTLRFQGGTGAGVRWLELGYGGEDLKHLTTRGYGRWAQAMGDAILDGFEER